MTPSPSPVPLASRLAKLPPYLFAEIDKNKREARARGVDLIDMGIGDPDLPTPPHIIEALKRSAETPANHRYPDYEGLLSFRTAVADWYRGRFGVALDPHTEVLTLIGSKGVQFFRRLAGAQTLATVTHLGDRPHVADLIGTVKVMLDQYREGKLDRVFLVNNEFVNTMSQKPMVRQILPVVTEADDKLD